MENGIVWVPGLADVKEGPNACFRSAVTTSSFGFPDGDSFVMLGLVAIWLLFGEGLTFSSCDGRGSFGVTSERVLPGVFPELDCFWSCLGGVAEGVTSTS